MMSANGKKGCVVAAIILVVFSVIAFAAPFAMTGTFWVGYCFGVIAIAAQLYFFTISFSKGEDAKSRFYGFPIVKIGVIYLVVQLILSIIQLIAAAVLPIWVALILNILVLAIAAIGSIAADIMREEIVRQDTVLKEDVNNMRGLQSLAASLPGLSQDEEIKKLLQELSDEFRYSDPVSSEDTQALESELKFMLEELQQTLISDNSEGAKGICLKTKVKLAERNRVCKLGK